MLLEGNALPSWSCYVSQKGQHKLPLQRAEVLLQCVAERQRDGAESLARVRTWSPVCRVVLSPHWLEIPLPVAGVVKCRQER